MRHCRVFLLALLSLILSTSQTFNIYTSHLEENEKGKNSRIVKLFMTINFQISLGPWNLKILLKFSTAQRIRCFRPRLENDLRLDATTGVYLSSNKDVQHKERWPSKQVRRACGTIASLHVHGDRINHARTGDETLRPDWPPRFLIYDPNFASPLQSYLPRYFCSWKTVQVYDNSRPGIYTPD